MTDKEIIQALECCANWKTDKCPECPYVTSDFSCTDNLKIDALDLINRQQEKLKIQANNIHALLKMKDVEIQRLKKDAIKEFAERLIENKYYTGNPTGYGTYAVMVDTINKIAKEMVGADNGT